MTEYLEDLLLHGICGGWYYKGESDCDICYRRQRCKIDYAWYKGLDVRPSLFVWPPPGDPIYN